MLGFFALQLDKTNISSAITTTFTTDIGITKNIVNNGNQLLFAAIVIFEIPSNMILARVGAPVWLTFECFAWGLVATFQAFINNKASFYATRFLLGLFEAGYLAGSLVVIGTFYTKKEMALRMTVLYTANYLAAGTSSLIAAGIFKLDGASGLRDWQVFLSQLCFPTARNAPKWMLTRFFYNSGCSLSMASSPLPLPSPSSSSYPGHPRGRAH